MMHVTGARRFQSDVNRDVTSGSASPFGLIVGRIFKMPIAPADRQ